MAIDPAVLRGEAMLGFVFGATTVRYRASPEPQRLRIEARFAAPMDRAVEADAWVDDLTLAGLGGGSEFAPDMSHARALSGDFASLSDELPAPKTDFRWELEVAGVSPKTLRHIVESLRARCVGMRIDGDLPLDDSPLSCTELDLQRWVASGEAWSYRGAWEPVPYPLEEAEIHRGAALRVHFEDELPPDATSRPWGLGWRFAALTGNLSGLLDHTGTRMGAVTLIPAVSRGKADVAVRWKDFDLAHDAARALILNTVTHLHQTGQPVRRALLQLS